MMSLWLTGVQVSANSAALNVVNRDGTPKFHASTIACCSSIQHLTDKSPEQEL